MRRITFNKQAASGFSLLEVLVAVVVLATGLLALAALQSSLARNSADSKARSRVAALISNQMDTMRAGGYDAVTPTAGTTVVADPNPDCSDTSLLSAIDAAACESAVNGLQLTTTVSEFTGAGAGFVAGAPGSPTDAQFKMVTIEAVWTDATGASRTIEQSTVLSALALQANSPLVSSTPGGFDFARPKVRQEQPFEEGMIPIAIGDGSETAATNPRPVVVGTNNTLIETKFNVFTYRAGGTDGTLIQQRIETTVIGCRCDYGRGGTTLGDVFGQNFRPTWWTGTRYTAPEFLDAARPAPAGPALVASPQSDLCTDCCRDHHDVSTDKIKFDPHRTGTHEHYLRTSSLQLATTGEYQESCRLIRVDGLWRVATDFQVEHIGYVATGPSEASRTPDPAYAGYYEEFILDSLRNKFAKVPGDTQSFSERFDDPVRLLNDSSLDMSPGSNDDNRIGILADPNDRRYLHTRAMLIDHIEEQAQETIDNALVNCTKSDKVECVLPHVPFTTINVTELARYQGTNSSVIDVVDGGTNFNDPLITQGMVSGRTTATEGDEAKAEVRFRKSNSALTAILAIDPHDENIWLPDPTTDVPVPISSDVQTYVAKSSGDFNGDVFNVLLGGHQNLLDEQQTNDPGIRWQIVDGFRYPCTPSSANKQPYAAPCQTNATLGQGAAVDIIVSGYHFFTSRAKNDSTQVQCLNAPTSGGTRGFAEIGKHAQGRVCHRFTVASAAVAGRQASLIEVLPTFLGSAEVGFSEETKISFNGDPSHHIGAGEQVNITFIRDGNGDGVADLIDILPHTPVCTYQGNGSTVSSAIWSSECDYSPPSP